MSHRSLSNVTLAEHKGSQRVSTRDWLSEEMRLESVSIETGAEGAAGPLMRHPHFIDLMQMQSADARQKGVLRNGEGQGMNRRKYNGKIRRVKSIIEEFTPQTAPSGSSAQLKNLKKEKRKKRKSETVPFDEALRARFLGPSLIPCAERFGSSHHS